MHWVPHAPAEVAERILARLWPDPVPQPRTGGTFPLTWFQAAGAERARAILTRWGGVLIADSVGLGKTYIALALVEEQLAGGGTVLVTMPASLRPMWRSVLGRLLRQGPGRPLHVLSHTELARGSYRADLAGRVDLVVVDEAHRFRNRHTRRLAALTELCAGARVVLLTATPVNNSTADLYPLLRLFAGDDAFAGLGVPSLRALLLEQGAEGGGGPELRRVLREMTVRRTRRMVAPELPPGGVAPRRGLAEPGPGETEPAAPAVRFPRSSPPRVVRYDDPRVPDLVRLIGGLELASYGTAADGDHGTPALLRLGLLKRLDSGAPALRRSLQRLAAILTHSAAALDRGLLLRPSGRGLLPEEADPLQLVMLDLVAEPMPPGPDVDRLRAAVRRDCLRVEQMARMVAQDDPKLDALRELLRRLTGDKVVVFTEYRDTAEALWRVLVRERAVGRVDGGGAWLGSRPAGRDAVLTRFAPHANGAKPPPERERVDLLIATDVLGEGLNLQDARHVVSYDLPWNPVRLIQRFGRVDRLGSPHEVVGAHLFLPAAGLEEMLRLSSTLRRKLGSIAATVGPDEALALARQLGGPPGRLSGGGAAGDAPDEDPLESLRIDWRRRRQREEVKLLRIDPPPVRPHRLIAACVAAPGPGGPEAVVLARIRGRATLLEVRPDGTAAEPGPQAVALLRAALAAPAPVAPCVGDHPARLRLALAATRHHADTLTATAGAPPPVRRAEPAAHLARRLRRAVADAGPTADPITVAAADRILQALGRPLPPRLGPPAHRLARHHPAGDLPGLVARAERLLASVPAAPHHQRRPPTGAHAVEAVLLACPPSAAFSRALPR
jgi:superfamily II DNA or RNA helicase